MYKIIDHAEIADRQAEDARVGAGGDLVASIDRRRAPQQPAVVDHIRIVERHRQSQERERQHGGRRMDAREPAPDAPVLRVVKDRKRGGAALHVDAPGRPTG